MLSGAGVHKNFGWKPVGKINFPAGSPCTLDITNLIDNGEILVIHSSLITDNPVNLTVNDDGAARYDWSIHEHGMSGGAAEHAQSCTAAASLIPFAPGTRTAKVKMELQYINSMLLIHIKSVSYYSATYFGATDVMGHYNQDAPYTSLVFTDSLIGDFAADFQLFKGVYAL